MLYLNSFIFCGVVCAIAEVILDKTNLTPGHITALFVVIGSFLDIFNIYDKLLLWAGAGACVPITSFGHLLIHGALDGIADFGLMGIANGMFSLTASGITMTIVFSFFLSLIFKPRD